MANLNLKRFNTSIDDLRRVIDVYMKEEVNGDDFKDSLEQGFEDAIRKLLKGKGFDVIEKKNVKNTMAIAEERLYSQNIDREIPDAGILCSDGLAFIEIKYCREESDYKADREKVSNYLTHEKCKAAGFLFLGKKKIEGWKACEKNPQYYFEWKFIDISNINK